MPVRAAPAVGAGASATLLRLYGLLRLQLNFFRPVRKLLSKGRIGSKVMKRYDAPHPPTSASWRLGS